MNRSLRNIRYGVSLVMAGLLGYAVIQIMDLWPVGVDDANILFVYSKHFAAGEGLVYNIGGERVEGFSSMLWMLITSIGYLLMDQPYPIFTLLNMVLVGYALGYTLQFVEASRPSNDAWPIQIAGVLLLAWTVANPSYFLWTITSLMETGLWSCLLIVTAILMLRMIEDGNLGTPRILRFALLNVLIVLTRPEGMAWVLYFSTMLLIIFRSRGYGWMYSFKRLAPVIALSAGAAIGLVLFRLAYFGFPFPNTYYAKMTPDKLYDLQFGIAYLQAFVLKSGFAVAFLLLATYGIFRSAWPVTTAFFGSNKNIPKTMLGLFGISSTILVGVILPVLMGGDIFGAFRFYQPTLPLLVLVLFYLPLPWARMQSQAPAIRVAIGIVALSAFTLATEIRWPSLSEDRQRVAHLFELTHRGMLAGQHMEGLFANIEGGLPSVGVSAAGGVKMGYRGEVMDTMGLNFTPMAHHSGDKRGTRGHAAFNKEVFWRYATDLVEPNLCPKNRPPENRIKNPENWLYIIYQGMFDDANFQSTYSYVAIEEPESGDWICSYVSKDLKNTLQSAGTFKLIDVN